MTLFWFVWTAAVVLVLIFGLVILIGAPYMPTLDKERRNALKLLDLKKGQTVVDLGAGDGSFLVLAASKGLNAVGYEINPILVFVSWGRTRKYRRQVKVRWGNFWGADISGADGIFVFLLDKFMARLDQKVTVEGKRGVKLVSHAFKIPDRKPLAKNGPLYLYKY